MSNQQLTTTTTPEALALLRAESRLAIADRVNSLQLSPLSRSVLLAKLTGTPIREATDLQLASMWTEVVTLLRIEFVDQDELKTFNRDLSVLSAWLRREHSPRGTTVEDVTRAYNHLVNMDLKLDGKPLIAYPMLDPKHVGEVLAAYRDFVNLDREVKEVLSKALYLPQNDKPSEADIDTQMEDCLRSALDFTRKGGVYFDLGNGLYMWLWRKGRIENTQADWDEATAEAQKVVPQDLAEQKSEMARAGQKGLHKMLEQRLAAATRAEGTDYTNRVRAQAYRIMLVNWLVRKCGLVLGAKPVLSATPKLPLPAAAPTTQASDRPKPFDHAKYVESLALQLPTMDLTAIQGLQRTAKAMNVLDVYLLTEKELNRRQAAKNGKSGNEPGRISAADWNADWADFLPDDYTPPPPDER